MGASSNLFRNHIWCPFLRHGNKISPYENNSFTTKLETCSPIKLCALRVQGLRFRVECLQTTTFFELAVYQFK